MLYQPIENYEIIGNMRTVDLVGMNVSVDWYCPPTSIHPASFVLTRGVWHFPKVGSSQVAV
jgi:hypothetical protein